MIVANSILTKAWSIFCPALPVTIPRRRLVTLRMLLAHSSGLPAYIKLFLTAGNKEELLCQALQVPLSTQPGTRAEYSDIGFILLGEALERITGEPLDKFCKREIFQPLELSTMMFKPVRHPYKAWIPPTERDRTFRRRLIQGEVNDENASVMGGVAGHAGCFATSLDVSVFAQCMLREGAPLVKKETLEIFTRRQQPSSWHFASLGMGYALPTVSVGKIFFLAILWPLGLYRYLTMD